MSVEKTWDDQPGSVLPLHILQSRVLAQCHLALLASVAEIPFIDPAWHNERLKLIFQYYAINPAEMETEIHLYAKKLLDEGNITDAWQVLLSAG